MSEYNLIKLNLARYCLKHVVNAYNIKELNIPFYICPTVFQALKDEIKNGCKLKFYHIDLNFFPTKEFKKDDFIVYPNYFGINYKNIEILSKKYPNLIIDNAQSFYTPPKGIASFYSLRKFFPVPCGAFLYIKKDFPINYPQDNNIYPQNFKPTYQELKENEIRLNNTPPLLMSKSIIITPNDKFKRLEQFYKLHQKYKQTNQLEIKLTEYDVPFIYPYMSSTPDKTVEALEKEEGKTILRYWERLPESFPEYKFYKNLVPIPFD